MMEGTRQYLRRNTVKLDRLVARLLKPRSMWESLLMRGEEVKRKCRGPTEDIIHYFTLMSSELHYLDIILKMENFTLMSSTL